MPAFSGVLLIFSFQFSLRFFNISLARPHRHCSVLLFKYTISDSGRCQKFGQVSFLYGTNIPGERVWVDSNGKNGN